MIIHRAALYLSGKLPPYYQAPFDKLELINLIQKHSKEVETSDLFKVIDSEDFYSMALNRMEKADSDGLVELLKELEIPEDAGGLSMDEMKKKTLDELKEEFKKLERMRSAQSRGLKFEKWLFNLFEHFELAPRFSYLRENDQIDGSFELDGKEYLMEAKWWKVDKKVGSKVSDTIFGKLNRCLVGTVALIISISGFSEEAVRAAAGHKNIILMDKKNLKAILERNCDLGSLIRKIRRKMAEEGKPYLD
jgi:hypothetical protein